MKNKLVLVLKGFIIGLGKVIPGVSGSLIAVSLGLYEKCIECISHFLKNLKYNIYFLGLIGLGVVFAVTFGSKIIIWLMNNWYLPTMFLFIGLIAGGIPSIVKEKKIKSIFDILLIVFSFAFIFVIGVFGTSTNFVPSKSIGSLLIISLLGFIDATTMVIPGISGTAIFILLGCYNFILDLFSKLLNFNDLLNNVWYIVSFGIGLIIGIIVVSKFMNFCFKNYKNKIYIIILGLSLSSIYMLFNETITNMNNTFEIIPGFILMFIGYKIVASKIS